MLRGTKELKDRADWWGQELIPTMWARKKNAKKNFDFCSLYGRNPDSEGMGLRFSFVYGGQVFSKA